MSLSVLSGLEGAVAEHVLSAPTLAQGFVKAAKILSVSEESIKRAWYKKIRTKNYESNIEKCLNDVARGRTEITKEDIDEAARKAGVHYHEALSTWASMSTHHKIKPSLQDNHDTEKNLHHWQRTWQYRWQLGEQCSKQIEKGMPVTDLAKTHGVSKVYIDEKTRTYRAFPNIDDREPSLSYTHHLVCANTDSPKEWLKKAKECKWSVARLRKAILRNELNLDSEKSEKEENINKAAQETNVPCAHQEEAHELSPDQPDQTEDDESCPTGKDIRGWRLGKWCSDRVKEGKSVVDLAQIYDKSIASIRDAIKTFNVFPNVSDRDPSLSYHHHHICANTSDPKGWLKKAKENNWSTRSLEKAISVTKLSEGINHADCENSVKLFPTTGQLFDLYQIITEQEEKIFVLRKLNLAYLNLLQKKNDKLLKIQTAVAS